MKNIKLNLSRFRCRYCAGDSERPVQRVQELASDGVRHDFHDRGGHREPYHVSCGGHYRFGGREDHDHAQGQRAGVRNSHQHYIIILTKMS